VNGAPGAVLPGGFEATALRSPLPARLGPDGSLRLQVRAGNWTVETAARAAENLAKISFAPAQGSWPKQEIFATTRGCASDPPLGVRRGL
jgi:hypothetical protein